MIVNKKTRKFKENYGRTGPVIIDTAHNPAFHV